MIVILVCITTTEFFSTLQTWFQSGHPASSAIFQRSWLALSKMGLIVALGALCAFDLHCKHQDEKQISHDQYALNACPSVPKTKQWTTSAYSGIIILFITVRCVSLNEGRLLPPLYHLLAPLAVLHWSGTGTCVAKIVFNYFGAVVYVWSLLYCTGSLVSKNQIMDQLMMMLPTNLMMFAVFVSLKIIGDVRDRTLRGMVQQNGILERILSQIPCVVWTTDLKGVFNWVKGSFSGRDILTGTDVAKMIETGFKIQTDLAQKISDKHARVVNEGVEEQYTFEGEHPEFWGPGRKVHQSVRLRPLRDGKDNRIMGVIGAAYETSSLYNKQRELQHAKEKYSMLIDCISDIIIGLDRDFCINFINRDTFLGYTKQQLLRRSLPSLFKSFSDTVETELHRVLNEGVEGSMSWWYDEATKENFTEQQLDAKKLQRQILDGKVLSFMCRINRSSQQQQLDELEQKKLESFDDLNGSAVMILSVRNMTASRRAIEQKRLAEEVRIISRSKEQFIRQLSHEIRNPLTCISGSLDMLESSKDSLTRLQKEYIHDSQAASQFLMEIMNDVLDSERLNANKIILQEVPSNLLDTVERITTMQASSAAHRGLEIICFVDPDIPSLLLFDRTRISQILSNLISNALKFTEKGYVYVSAHLLEQDEFTATVQLRCEDTGVGIRQEDIERIFKPFMQFMNHYRPTEFRGFGLGLTIVKNLVDMMRGSIDIQSEVGVGSAFSVQLPMHKVQDEENHPIIPISHTLSKSRFDSVIVVSQCQPTFDSMQRYLSALQVDFIQNCQYSRSYETIQNRTDYAQELIKKVKRSISSLGEARSIAILLDYSNDDLVQVVDMLHALGCTCILLRHRVSTATHCSLNNQYRTLNKPVHLMELMQALCSPDSDKIQLRSSRTVENANSTQQAAVVQQRSAPTISTHVMVVEDNPTVAKILTKYLNRMGYENIITAKNGQEAVDFVQRYAARDIECILMDLQMPVMDGFRATELIRQMDDPRKSAIPIIAVTANSDRDTRDRCKRGGFDDFIQKPFIVEEVTATFRRIRKEA